MDLSFLEQLPPEQQQAVINNLLESPALDPPPGVTPNLDDPGARHGLGYGIVVLCAVLATTSVLLRLCSRLIIKQFRLEDALFITALGLSSLTFYAFYMVSISPGLYVHQYNLRVKTVIPMLRWVHFGSIGYGLVILFLKTGILLDWIHIFVPRGKRNAMFWISHVLIWSNVLFYGIGTIVEIFQCTPREKIWNPLFIGGKCPVKIQMHMLSSTVLNLVSDIAILALPQKVIWSLQLSTSKKVGVSLLFTVGIFACICATIRLYYTNKLIHVADQIYALSPMGLWTIAEMTTGFLIMGIPSIPKVAQKLPVSTSMVSLVSKLKSMVTTGSRVSTEKGSGHQYRPQVWQRFTDDSGHDLVVESQTATKKTGHEENQITVTRTFDVHHPVDLPGARTNAMVRDDRDHSVSYME